MSYEFKKSGELKPLTEEELLELDKGPPVIACDQGTTDDGRPYWLYIAVKPSKYNEFHHLTKARVSVRFTDYGTILRYGYEKEIPQSVKDEMKQQYGCDEKYMTEIARKIDKERKVFLRQQEDIRINDIVEMLKNKKLN